MAAPTKTAPAAPKAPEAPKTEAPAAEKPKRKRGEAQQTVYPTAEAAIKEAEARTTGARRPFKVSYEGKDTFVVAHSEHHAAWVVASTLPGFTIEKLAGRAKSKPLGVGSILDAISAMPEAERAAIMAQIKALGGK